MANVIAMMMERVSGCSNPGMKKGNNATKLPAVPGANGEYPEKKPVAMNRVRNETEPALLCVPFVKRSEKYFFDKLPVFEHVHSAGSNRHECNYKHHPE